MNFQQIWQQYDFTESELLSMGWQFPYDYVLNLNYYWRTNSTNYTSEVATNDQFLNIILKTCIRLDVQLNPNPDELDRKPANLGTIVGWEQVTPSPWLENLSLSPNELLHLLFEIGGNNKIEAVCRSLVVEQLVKRPLALSL